MTVLFFVNKQFYFRTLNYRHVDQNMTIPSDVAQTSSYIRFFLRANHPHSLMFYLLNMKFVSTTQYVFL
jgi:hypothetical protein